MKEEEFAYIMGYEINPVKDQFLHLPSNFSEASRGMPW